MTLKEAAEKWGIGDRRINTLCMEDCIPGATKLGNMWEIPSYAEEPRESSIRSGKYIKENQLESR